MNNNSLMDYKKDLYKNLTVSNDMLNPYQLYIKESIQWVESEVKHNWFHSFLESKDNLLNFKIKYEFLEGEVKFFIYLPTKEVLYFNIYNGVHDNAYINYKLHPSYPSGLVLECEDKSSLQQLVDILSIKRTTQQIAELEELKKYQGFANPQRISMYIRTHDVKRKISLLQTSKETKEELIQDLHTKLNKQLTSYNQKWSTNVLLLQPYSVIKKDNHELVEDNNHLSLPFILQGHCVDCGHDIHSDLSSDTSMILSYLSKTKIEKEVMCKNCGYKNLFEFNLSINVNLLNK